MEWLKKQDFSYRTDLEIEIDELVSFARQEMLESKLRVEIDKLGAEIDKSKDQDFQKFKDEIIVMLKKEILSRKHLYRGNIEAGIEKDRDIRKAMEILLDDQLYQGIIAKKNGVNSKY